MKSRVILYAPNIHVGGGAILLQSLLKIWPKDHTFLCYFDARASASLDFENECNVSWVKPTIMGRLKAEASLSKVASAGDVIIFFNSLPPLFGVRARVIVFLQNRNLVENIALRSFRFKQAVRICIERSLLYFFRSRIDEYIVQTDSFKRVVEKWHSRKSAQRDIAITVFPFMESKRLIPNSILENPKRQYDFIYVADGLAQKNHLALFDAWELLAEEGLFPQLAVTLPNTETHLLNKVNELRKLGLNITSLGWLPHSELVSHYKVSGALIFPSLRESFGLPLVEATKLNVPILASELDFVYDVCQPAETFDPKSPRSIARAVKRFKNISTSIRKVQDPAAFVDYIIQSSIDGGEFTDD